MKKFMMMFIAVGFLLIGGNSANAHDTGHSRQERCGLNILGIISFTTSCQSHVYMSRQRSRQYYGGRYGQRRGYGYNNSYRRPPPQRHHNHRR